MLRLACLASVTSCLLQNIRVFRHRRSSLPVPPFQRSPRHLVPLIVFLFLDLGFTVMSTFSSTLGLPGTPNYEESEKVQLLTT